MITHLKASYRILKTVTLIGIWIIAASCSNDDDSSSRGQDSVKLLERINLNGLLVNFDYNDDHTVRGLNYNDVNLVVSYLDGNVSAIEDNDHQYQFQYDAMGHISSYSIDGQMKEVVYEPENRSYTFERLDNTEIDVSLLENGEIGEIINYNLLGEQVNSLEIIYSNSGKGSMYNSESINLPLMMLSDDYSSLVYLISKVPPQLVIGNGLTFTLNNTYDEDDFLSRITVDDDGSIDFFYSN